MEILCSKISVKGRAVKNPAQLTTFVPKSGFQDTIWVLELKGNPVQIRDCSRNCKLSFFLDLGKGMPLAHYTTVSK